MHVQGITRLTLHFQVYICDLYPLHMHKVVLFVSQSVYQFVQGNQQGGPPLDPPLTA